MTIQRPERVFIRKSDYAEGCILYCFEHRGERQAVWLHKIAAEAEHIRGAGYLWKCSCGANETAPGAPLTTAMLWAAWSHFNTHIDPPAVTLRVNGSRWNRGGTPDGEDSAVWQDRMEKMFELEVARLLGLEPDLPVQVINVCGECGETFEISKDDPHWSTGKGPICPTRTAKVDRSPSTS